MTSPSASDGFIPGPCEHCDGTGQTRIAFITPKALAHSLGVTERRIRQLVDEGVIEPPVRGKGYPGISVADYLDWRYPRRHELEMRKLVEQRKARR